MKISFVFAIILFSTLYIICPIILIFLYNKRKVNKVLSIILLCLYSIVLCVGVFSHFSKDSQYVYINFDYSGQWASENITFGLIVAPLDLAINLVMLIPYGVIFILLRTYKHPQLKLSKHLIFSFLIGFAIGIFIEFFQFTLPIKRSIQFSDVILNSISCLLGSIYFVILMKIKDRIRKKKDQKIE